MPPHVIIELRDDGHFYLGEATKIISKTPGFEKNGCLHGASDVIEHTPGGCVCTVLTCLVDLWKESHNRVSWDPLVEYGVRGPLLRVMFPTARAVSVQLCL